MSYTPNPSHLHEWFASAVDEDIIRLNVKSLEGNSALEHLLYALPENARRNDRRLRDKYLRQYDHVTKGGWWISGLDPLNNWEPMEWGRFKPDFARMGWDKEAQKPTEKPVKYESPPKTPNRVTYLRVPLHIWEMVSKRYGVPMPEQIVTTEAGEAIGFWAWVVSHPEIPIVLSEGEKKAASLLSLGFVAVGLPGIWGGRIGERELERMHPDLIPVAQTGREFIILFDYETNPSTRKQVYKATTRTGWAITRQASHCKVALLPGQEKGIDDWIIALGKKANTSVTALIGDARKLTEYQAEIRLNRSRGLHKYRPDIMVNTRFLSDAVTKLPDSGLICIQSDMGTGKTELLSRWRKEHPEESFLNNGHRVNLLRNLAGRLETVMYNAVNGGSLGETKALSITIDSLYKMANNLQAYGCVFVDEACQYLAHLLKSKTCRNHRASILEVLEAVVYRAKLVVLADAHLDDLTIDFFRAMRPQGESPFIIQNNWKSGGREVFWYEGTNSSALIAQIHAQVLTGKKAIVVSDSKRFIKKLERSFLMLGNVLHSDTQDDTPEPEADRQLRVWAIHSENSGSEENQLFIQEINTALKSIDVLLTSPSLGTGVDISVDYFDIIFGAFHAVSQSANECAQQLWRNRTNIPMHVWVAERPPFGYNETNPRRIKERYLQKNEMTAFLIRIDRETGRRGVEKDWALDISCQLEAQRNLSINNLRQDLRSLLDFMGNTIIPMGDGANEAAKNLMKTACEILDREHCEAVANAKDIDRKTYDARQKQDYLKPEESLECEKFRIFDSYGMPVTPELVEKDDSGRLIRKLVSLEAILLPPEETIVDEQGREFQTPPQLVAERDKQERERLSICTDWGNYSTSWQMRHSLGLRDVLLSMMLKGQEFTGTEEILLNLRERSHQFAPHIKQILGITIPVENVNPMWILGTYLQQLGLSTVSRRIGARGHRVRQYTLNPDDLTFAQQVLEYRQLRREEKERQRQLDKETAERRTAGMLAQYGINPESPPVSTPPPFIGGKYFEGGSGHQSTEAENERSNQPNDDNTEDSPFTERAKKVARLAMNSLRFGVKAIQDLLQCLSEDERFAVMSLWEDADSTQFARFLELAPNWVEWCIS
ncbi:DUF3854 domain-containing protein [Scytonema sp. UIC 10036]|uniref:plasmid replication protein, CyRepA1 family n=1 Tax=Scytonema sp. UIC 10036 TaxID=2304196 RepID=UPI0012DA7A31|nr:plasmid replication protein, CyRepA1 family [Scytonema sp. UIC 10036]MUG98745.1 DUF3854 domain-containing protein [Scytonema sp. UIC 10036]